MTALMFLYVCSMCDKPFSTKPWCDEVELLWLRNAARNYCSKNCLDNHADKLGGNEECWWD